ncbi:Rim [Aphelenchoides avenae]|nr:Rim [Aphelenchus avenae]
MDPSMMPDLSHLSAEERAIIEEVFKRQQAEEQKEEAIAQQADKELEDIERQIAERAETARRLVGTQDDAICQICQKTKFADGIGHKCFYCQLRSCARCGGKTTAKNKVCARTWYASVTERFQNIWACSLCQKRQQILARTGKWMQGAAGAAGGPDGAGRSSPTPSQTSKAGSAASTSSATAAQARTAQPSAPTQPMPSSAMTRSEPGAPPASSAVPLGVSSQKQAASLHQDQRRQNTLTRQPSLETESQFAKMNGGPPSATAAAPHHIPTSSAAPPPHTAATTNTLTNGPSMPPQNGYGSSRSAAASSSQAAPGGLHDRRSSRRDRDHVAADQPHVNGTRGGGPTSSVPPSTSAAPQPYGDDRHGRRPSANASGVPHHHRESRLSRGQTDDRDYGPDYQPEDGAARSRSPGYRDRDDRKRYDDRYDSRQATSRNDRDSRQRRSDRDRTRGERKPSHSNEAHLPRAVPPAEPSPLAPAARRTSPVPPRNRRTKLSRQLKSLSSSEEEEVPSTSADRTSLAEQDFSEKDLLRYIYGTQKVSKNGKRTTDALTAAGATASGPEAPPTSPRVVPGNMLATKIRNYLSHPVSWQPSADQRRLIGHMVLNRNVTDAGGGDLGLKVIGGRHSATGRLGAFVTKVKRGSVADTVGQLRPVT